MESSIEQPICIWAEQDGWFVRKLGWIGRKGAPDRLFIKDGRVVFIEFKRPGAIPTGETLQVRERRRIVEHGGESHFVDSLEAGCKILGLAWPRETSKRVSTAPKGRSISGPRS